MNLRSSSRAASLQQVGTELARQQPRLTGHGRLTRGELSSDHELIHFNVTVPRRRRLPPREDLQ